MGKAARQHCLLQASLNGAYTVDAHPSGTPWVFPFKKSLRKALLDQARKTHLVQLPILTVANQAPQWKPCMQDLSETAFSHLCFPAAVIQKHRYMRLGCDAFPAPLGKVFN